MSQRLDAAIKAATMAGKMLYSDFYSKGKTGIVESKGGVDRVTGADKMSERIIRDIIEQAFPADRFKGEEFGDNGKFSDYIWHVDPICGTFNFMRKSPEFAVSIGLEYNGKVTAGAVYLPALKELYFAEEGKGAFMKTARSRPKRVYVSKTPDLENALLTSDGGERTDEKIERQYSLMAELKKAPLRNVITRGSTPYALVEVASGRKDAHVQLYESSVHFLGGVAIVLEAGGTVTNRNGSFNIYDRELLIASNGPLHEPLSKIVNQFLG